MATAEEECIKVLGKKRGHWKEKYYMKERNDAETIVLFPLEYIYCHHISHNLSFGNLCHVAGGSCVLLCWPHNNVDNIWVRSSGMLQLAKDCLSLLWVELACFHVHPSLTIKGVDVLW